jgi:tRNA (cytidine/uridine-2'-O-)-methyltransferase
MSSQTESVQTQCNKDDVFCRRHVVLVAPEVHWNTGNVGRTCLGAGAMLHLIRPLGFSLDDRQVKRAGLDYWPKVALKVWDDFDAFLARMKPTPGQLVLFTKSGRHPFWQMPRMHRIFMVFGSETKGLPPSILHRYPDQTYHIPIQSDIRCLNLSTSVGIALFENVRQWESDLSM